jgi:hypothetical protein
LSKKEREALRSRIEMILTAVLAVLALAVTAVLVEETLQAYFNLRQQQSVVATADIRTIDSGMTIPAISQRYHVPESDLYGSLRLKGARLLPQASLIGLAARVHLPVTNLIRNIQIAILVYQDLHPPQGEEVLSRLLIMLINWFQQYGYPVQ